MIRFAVADVERGKLKPPLERDKAVYSMLAARVEATYTSEKPLVACTDRHALAQAAYFAFYEHHPLVLSPDAVWLTLAQGFALHVNLNAEALRERFVRHEGKKTLTVVHDGWRLGTPYPHETIVADFSEQLKRELGKTRDLIVCDFSTTTLVERVASEIVLMDAFQAYFKYLALGGCGIPEVILLGTPADWRSIRTRAQVFSEYGLERWTDALLPVLDEIVRTAEGHVDRAFWQSCFRYQGGSGPDLMTGWMVTLFPYFRFNKRSPLMWNEWLDWKANLEESTHSFYDIIHGLSLGMIPGSLATAPVTHRDASTGVDTELRFVGGLFGVVQDPASGALAPEAGWAITYA